jgi:hypothetical protein
MKIVKRFPLVAITVFVSVAAGALAEDAYYNIPLSALNLTEGTLPPPDTGWSIRRMQMENVVRPYAILDSAGEVFVSRPEGMPWERNDEPNVAALSVRTTKGSEITGRLFMPKTNLTGLVQLRFRIAPTDSKAEAKEAFFKAKQEYYQQLQGQNLPGGAWFRHQAQEAAKVLDKINSVATGMAMMRRGRVSEIEESYDLISGGRALSENLQLDRALPTTKAAEESVDITNVTGITVKEMNWKELIKDARPELDPLAAFVPADQHAIFFPSFSAMVQMIDEADVNGTPVLQLFEPRSEDANSRERYQKQLCLGLSDLSRLLGPQVIASVAFTGSDPFLRVGTDIAVLFEARNVDAVKAFLAARQKMAQLANVGAKVVQGEIKGVAYSGVVSADHTVSSYLASVSNVVVICNSRVQLETLIQVAKGGAAPLSAQEEYLFFRSRYPRTMNDETAFVVLSDATIRRWCGPKWRIADSRRTRAGAVLAELQAAHLEDIAAGKTLSSVLTNDLNLPDAGELRLTPAGVTSATYGSLNFMTPITELPIARVTRAEADAYQRWRDNYQRNWRQAFDPIAIRFTLSTNRLKAELTVMPLILATDYREMLDISSGAEIASNAGDPHTNSLLHLIFAVNTQSHSVQEAGSFVGNLAPGLKANPFGWLGQSVSVYADEDPFWDRLLQATNTDTFFETNFPDLPVALHCEVKNALGLAAFLTALHAFVDQSAPRMTTWENLDYHGQPYVKITAKGSEMGQDSRNFAIYYASSARSLVVTLSEPLLKRSLDRRAASMEQTNTAAVVPWLGKSLSAVASRRFVDVLQTVTRESYQTRLQVLAWNNLPILNEWKRLYPDKDPVNLHEQLWGTKLLCPGGGAYVWNEKWQTMESTVFGHPGEPRTGNAQQLLRILAAQFGVTFENQGLSAKAVLER